MHFQVAVDHDPGCIFRRGWSNQLRSGRVAPGRHIVGRGFLIQKDRMGKPRWPKPVSRIAKGLGFTTGRAVQAFTSLAILPFTLLAYLHTEHS